MKLVKYNQMQTLSTCALSSAVERWSPKPNVVGSIPTGREGYSSKLY